jgi:hypothetical protein
MDPCLDWLRSRNGRLGSLAMLLFVAAIALTPSAAQAHGKHSHEAQSPASSAASRNSSPGSALAPREAGTRLSTHCPAGHGDNCCCGERPMLSRAGEPPSLAQAAWNGWAILSQRSAGPTLLPSPAPSAPPLAEHRPRAPPAAS